MSAKSNKVRITVAAVLCLLVVVATVLCVHSDRLSAFAGLRNNKPTDDYVEFYDVGQADSCLIYSNGYVAVIDTGTDGSSAELTKKILKSGIRKIDALILTHRHSDHIGGAEYLISHLDVKNVIVPDLNDSSDEAEVCEELDLAISKEKINEYEPVTGTVIKIGNFELTVLQYFEDAAEENDRSLIIMAENGDKKFLFTGDASIAAENKLIDDNIDFDCDVLKVAHHGSSKSSTVDFLNIATPEYSVISVGATNTYGHPSESALKRLENEDSIIYRTDRDGDVIFTVKNGNIYADTHK